MECTRIWDLLSSYLDGDLPDRERERMADHIRQCIRCAGEERALRETLSLLRNLPAEGAPPELLRGVQSRIGETETVPLWKRLFLPAHVKIPIEAAAVVLVFLLVYGIQKELPSTTPVPSPPASAESGKPAAGSGTDAMRPDAVPARAPGAGPSPETERETTAKPAADAPAVPAGPNLPAVPEAQVRAGGGATGKEPESVELPSPGEKVVRAGSALSAGPAAPVRDESGVIGKEPEVVVRPSSEKPVLRYRSEIPAGLASRVSTGNESIEPFSPRESPTGESRTVRAFAPPPRLGLMRQEPFGREVTVEVDRESLSGVEDRIAAVAMRLGGAVRRQRVRIATGRMEEALVVSDSIRVLVPAVFADVFLEELEKLGSISPEGRPGKLDIPPGPSTDSVAYTVRIRVK